MDLGDKPQNNPHIVFLILWSYFNEHYSLFEVRNKNRSTYLPEYVHILVVSYNE